jgi:hypothetical protein
MIIVLFGRSLEGKENLHDRAGRQNPQYRNAGKDRTGTDSIRPGVFCKFREPDLNVSFNPEAALIGGPEAG